MDGVLHHAMVAGEWCKSLMKSPEDPCRVFPMERPKLKGGLKKDPYFYCALGDRYKVKIFIRRAGVQAFALTAVGM